MMRDRCVRTDQGDGIYCPSGCLGIDVVSKDNYSLPPAGNMEEIYSRRRTPPPLAQNFQETSCGPHPRADWLSFVNLPEIRR